eukprot:3013575-Rhodomonas_salina.1
MSGTGRAHGAMDCPKSGTDQAKSGTNGAYGTASADASCVLWLNRAGRSPAEVPYLLRACYGMSGTKTKYATTRRPPYQLAPGTDVGCAAMHCQVLA